VTAPVEYNEGHRSMAQALYAAYMKSRAPDSDVTWQSLSAAEQGHWCFVAHVAGQASFQLSRNVAQAAFRAGEARGFEGCCGAYTEPDFAEWFATIYQTEPR